MKDDFNSYLIEVNIEKNNNSLVLFSNFSSKLIIRTPCSFKKINSALETIYNIYEYRFDKFNYNPCKQVFQNSISSVNLNDIHNKILLSLIIYKKGVDKTNLYKHLWNNDKEIYMNKLDTHLTNLKNLLKTKINYILKIKSKNNVLMID